MADEEARPQTIQERMKALKLAQVGRIPGQPDGPPPAYAVPRNPVAAPAIAKPRPPPPPRPSLPARPASVAPVIDKTVGNRPEQTPTLEGASANGMDGISRPALPPRTFTQASGSQLPPRTPSSSSSPALPPRNPSITSSANGRRPSELQLSRRDSNESISSIGTTKSSISGISNGTSITSRSDRFAIRAPDFNPSSLPALPPKRTQEEKDEQAMKDARQKPTRSGNSFTGMLRKNSTPSVPARPAARRQPSSQSRNNGSIGEEAAVRDAMSVLPARRTVEPPPMRKSALSMGFNNGPRPNSVPATNGAPPPIPTSSRPDLAALQSSKPKVERAAPTQVANGQATCLHCRDFSGPDNHAARFSRQSIPSQDVGWLANQLTAPFPSATDKARAIFTWLHHNIAYDTKAFFANSVKSCTPQSTIASGLAVCQGYADTFAALALKAGLEAMVISGASKGYGHTQMKPGDPMPPFNASHAWNVCRIDGGGWKLIDPCWGAGTVGDRTFTKRFAPERFTQSNDDFGLDHFPTNQNQQYRCDGRIVSYEEFIRGNKSGTAAMTYSGFITEEGIAKISIKPVANPILLSQLGSIPTVRFSFQKVCPHWDPIRNGQGAWYLYIMQLEGCPDKVRSKPAFQHRDGIWWCDVPVQDLGGPGQKVHLRTVTSFDGRDGRGLSVEEYRSKLGRCGMGFGGVAMWEIA